MRENSEVNIQLMSDLHLESNPHFVPQAAPGADVLVLAGDIGSYQNTSALTRLDIADFGLGRFANWPCPVVFVPGNHEYDGQEFTRRMPGCATPASAWAWCGWTKPCK